MAALIPPPNNAGVPLPPVPGNPTVPTDITNAGKYVGRLSASELAGHANHATSEEVGAAEAFKDAVINAQPGAAALLWAVELRNDLHAQIAQGHAQMNAQFAQLNGRFNELPILFANSQAGPQGILHNPTILGNDGWGPVLHHPVSRDELNRYTEDQCIHAAGQLGLPPMAHGTLV